MVRTYSVELIFVIEDLWFTDIENDIEEILAAIDDSHNPYEIRCDGEYQSWLYTLLANVKRIM